MGVPVAVELSVFVRRIDEDFIDSSIFFKKFPTVKLVVTVGVLIDLGQVAVDEVFFDLDMSIRIGVLFGENQYTALININPLKMAIKVCIVNDQLERIVDIQSNAVSILVPVVIVRRKSRRIFPVSTGGVGRTLVIIIAGNVGCFRNAKTADFIRPIVVEIDQLPQQAIRESNAWEVSLENRIAFQ